MRKRTNIFSGGIPTAPDVKTLITTFGIPAPKTTVTHDDIAKAIGTTTISGRYRTVVNAWRKALYEEHNVLMVAVFGIGFSAADPDVRVDVCVKNQKSAIKHVKKSVDVLTRTNVKELTTINMRLRDHMLHVGSAFVNAHRNVRKQIRFEKKLLLESGK
jgi:hypothetical protein